MSFDFLIALIFVSCLCIILSQCVEFIQNYDYIKKFNGQYSKYEYVFSPSYNYTDSSILDPNEAETNVNNKWRCYNVNKTYYGVSQRGMIIDNTSFITWNNYTSCISDIFGSYLINFKNPCIKDSNNDYCNIFKSIKWT